MKYADIKVGQKLKVVRRGNGMKASVGDVVEVSDLANDWVYVEGNKRGSGCGQNHAQFEPMKEPAPVKPKVGDKIRVISGAGCHMFKTGTVAEIRVVYATGKVCAGGNDGFNQFLLPEHFELLPSVDLTKPVFTAEGTPVVIVTTESRDPKYPVLAYEGNAKMLSKYTKEGVHSRGPARRNLTNDQPPVVPEVAKEYYLNLYEGDGTTAKPVTGSRLHDSLEKAERIAGLHRGQGSLVPTGIVKVTLVQGRFPKAE